MATHFPQNKDLHLHKGLMISLFSYTFHLYCSYHMSPHSNTSGCWLFPRLRCVLTKRAFLWLMLPSRIFFLKTTKVLTSRIYLNLGFSMTNQLILKLPPFYFFVPRILLIHFSQFCFFFSQLYVITTLPIK